MGLWISLPLLSALAKTFPSIYVIPHFVDVCLFSPMGALFAASQNHTAAYQADLPPQHV